MKNNLFKIAVLSLAVVTTGIQAKEYEIVNVVKIAGIPWFKPNE